MKEKVAIQGVEGSFHHQVAREFFGREIQTLSFTSFEGLAQALAYGEAGQGVMAIENSIAGAILPNYALIDQYSLKITGEHYLPIEMNLMALPGQSIDAIQKVCSHPMALLQCRSFFARYPHIRLVEDSDTAEVARRIAQQKLMGVAALAGATAANLYELDILAQSVQTLKQNATRFLMLSKEGGDMGDPVDKASLKFLLPGSKGSLAGVLNIISDCQLDMTKIQSVPLGHTMWKYAFFVDVCYRDPGHLAQALARLEQKAEQLKVLGTYKNQLL